MKRYLIANWKMQLTIAESVELARLAIELFRGVTSDQFEFALCPSHLAIDQVGKVLQGSNIKLGAQDVAHTDKASLTGASSPLQLKELGVSVVIVGHSERRANFSETNEVVNKKVLSSLNHGFQTILCVGESARERDAGKAEEVVRSQVRESLRSAQSNENLLIAYEPVWAIGTGKAVEPELAFSQASVLRDELKTIFNSDQKALEIPLLYGGSVDGDNVTEFTKDQINGTLVGGASQNKSGLTSLIEALVNA